MPQWTSYVTDHELNTLHCPHGTEWTWQFCQFIYNRCSARFVGQIQLTEPYHQACRAAHGFGNLVAGEQWQCRCVIPILPNSWTHGKPHRLNSIVLHAKLSMQSPNWVCGACERWHGTWSGNAGAVPTPFIQPTGPEAWLLRIYSIPTCFLYLWHQPWSCCPICFSYLSVYTNPVHTRVFLNRFQMFWCFLFYFPWTSDVYLSTPTALGPALWLKEDRQMGSYKESLDRWSVGWEPCLSFKIFVVKAIK